MERFRQAGLSYDPLALEAPPQGDIYNYQDGLAPFLRLRVTHKSRVWVFDTHGRGSKFKRNIGSAFLTGLLEARMKALEWAKMLENGIIPPTIKELHDKAAKELVTIESLWEQRFEMHLSKCSTAREFRRCFNCYWAPIRKIPVASLTATTIQMWINKLGAERGHCTANKQLQTLTSTLNWGNKFDLIDLRKLPTRAVTKFREYGRERFLSADEFARLDAALADTPNQNHADIIRLAILTGARKSNVFAMSWKHIDLATGVWRIPASEAKGRRTITVALTDAALSILMRRSLASNALDCNWVFPASSKRGHVMNASQTWNSIRKKCGFADLHFHDLRHTVGSALGATGANVAIIQRVLGHATPAMSMKYTHLDVGPVKQAQELAQLFLGVKPALLPYRANNSEPREDAKSTGSSDDAFTVDASGAEEIQKLPITFSKNADARIAPIDQIIVEGKILATIKQGGYTRKCFYKKIGAQYPINSREMDRILFELEQRGLIASYREAPNWSTQKYMLSTALGDAAQQNNHDAQGATLMHGAKR